MIDYDKLKQAHILIENLSYGLLTVRHSKYDGTNFYFEYVSADPRNKREGFYFNSIDELISKLKELTKPQPKYQVGNYAWIRNEGDKPENKKIIGVEDDEGSYRYSFLSSIGALGYSIDESYVYSSKKELINAQIDYWEGLREPEKCQHEPGGKVYVKCKKCGEFYR